MKYKFFALFVIEILLQLFMIYYLFIFNCLYTKSKISFLINFILSELEELIFSVGICIIITASRKIALAYGLKNLYNTSKFINNKF